MYNSNQFNTLLYWVGTKRVFNLCKYWEYDLNDWVNTFINNIRYLWQNNIDYNIYDFWDRKFVNIEKYTKDNDIKEIEIIWTIKASDRVSLISEVEKMKWNIIRQEKILSIKEWTIIKKANAYCKNIEFEENHYNITFMKYSLVFNILWGLEKDTANSYSYNITSNLSETIENIWENRTDWLMLVNVNSATWTYLYIEVNWTSIKINSTPSWTYRLNSWKLLVEQNWTEVNYTGWFEKLDLWFNTIKVESDWSFDFDVNFKYNVTYR